MIDPKNFKTNRKIVTDRGTFTLVNLSELEMLNQGYTFHHATEDTRYFIMSNGSTAYAIDMASEIIQVIKQHLEYYKICDKFSIDEDDMAEQTLEFTQRAELSIPAAISSIISSKFNIHLQLQYIYYDYRIIKVDFGDGVEVAGLVKKGTRDILYLDNINLDMISLFQVKCYVKDYQKKFETYDYIQVFAKEEYTRDIEICSNGPVPDPDDFYDGYDTEYLWASTSGSVLLRTYEDTTLDQVKKQIKKLYPSIDMNILEYKLIKGTILEK